MGNIVTQVANNQKFIIHQENKKFMKITTRYRVQQYYNKYNELANTLHIIILFTQNTNMINKAKLVKTQLSRHKRLKEHLGL